MFDWRTASPWVAAIFALQFCTFLGSSNAAGPTYKQYKYNLKGDTLVLDVGGLHSLGNHPMEPLITTPKGCQGWCDRLPGCTGWTFCSKRDGCGSGCKNYAKQNPTPGGYSGACCLDPNQKLPIKYFGPLSGQANKCTDDRWSFGLCSLKRPVNPSKPEFWSQNTAEGWVSGVVILPAECKGLSATTCRACAASKNPSACRACATSASKYSKGLFDTVTTYDTTWTQGCAACAALSTSQRATCNACLAQGKTCGACAVKRAELKSTVFFDTASCLSCVTKNPAVSQECTSCAGVKDAAKRLTCGTCVSELKSYLVQNSGGSSKYRIARGDYCANCVSSNTVANANKCIACGKTMPDNDDCYECSAGFYAVPASARGTCYECAAKAQLGRDKQETISAGGASQCAPCLGTGSLVVPPKSKPVCKACLYDPKVTSKGKYWCNSCTELSDSKARDKCFACLKKTSITSYYSQCVATS